MPTKALLEFLHRKAGDYHRGTIVYDGNETDILHLRFDVREARIASEFDCIVRRLRPESDPDEERAFPFGDLHATVRIFDEAIILHFPMRSDECVVVSLEPETARDLNTFIGECEKRLRE